MNTIPVFMYRSSTHRAFAPRIFACSAALLLLFCMSGCGVLPKKENIQVVAPHIKIAPDAAWPMVNWQLSVARPTANRMLDSNRIVVSPTPGALQVYKGAAWTDAAPDVLERAVVEAFEDSGKIAAVGRQATAVRADYLLLLDIRHYEAVYATAAASPSAIIEINAKLIDTTGHVAATRTFSQSTPASGTAVPAVAQAFDTALTALTGELIGWTLTAGQQAQAAAKTPKK